ncbi:hypothetical protein ACFE04_022082 [Oxalis oulophora]
MEASSNNNSHEEKRRLFVGGIPKTANKDHLKEYFSRFGEVEESLIIMDRTTGNHKGFGFITFVSPSAAKEALNAGPLYIFCDYKHVDVNYAKPKTANDKEEQSEGDDDDDNKNFVGELNPKKIFLGGLPLGISEEEIKDFFKIFGEITEVVVMKDRESKKSRGFGFITFELEESADNLLKNKFYELEDKNEVGNKKKVEVKRAIPKVYKNNENVHYYNNCSVQNNCGNIYGDHNYGINCTTFYGIDPRGVLYLIPVRGIFHPDNYYKGSTSRCPTPMSDYSFNDGAMESASACSTTPKGSNEAQGFFYYMGSRDVLNSESLHDDEGVEN